MKRKILQIIFTMLVGAVAQAQVNSGSDGSDGVFNPTTSTNINMADHPDGIYNYQSVNIRSGVTVTFIPNSANTPLVWLVQSNCTIAGIIDVSGQSPDVSSLVGGEGGPGGFRGGNGGWASGTAGQGPGGGMLGGYSFSASFATLATIDGVAMTNGYGPIYGNSYIIPLIGGSGGGGTTNANYGGGGGGGAILIAANQSINLSGTIKARGGDNSNAGWSVSKLGAGGGSGGSIRMVATTITGSGITDTTGGVGGGGSYGGVGRGGTGRIRVDALNILCNFSGTGIYSQGYQPIIIPPPSEAVSLAIQSVGGVAVASNPSGLLIAPDVFIPGQQTNPIPIVVQCVNIPLDTPISVEVKPTGQQTITTTAPNTVGTVASSTATVMVMLPHGGGTIQASAVSGITNLFAAATSPASKTASLAKTGWTADGERFASVKITATLAGAQQIAYLTESGKSYVLPSR